MPLNREQSKQLHNALLAAFSPSSLKQMVKFGMNETLDQIVSGGNFSAVVFNLIEWAEQRGLEQQLIEAAYQDNPGNPLLKAFYQNFTSSSSAGTGSPSTSTTGSMPQGQPTAVAANPPPTASSAAPPVARTKVFISYSHNGEKWLKRLQVHLKPLEDAGIIDRWDDTLIGIGDEWEEQIEKALAEATVAILLVSADFLASGFITRKEVPPLLTANKEKGLLVMSVIVEPCDFEGNQALSKFQAANSPSRPLSTLPVSKREEIFVKLVKEIRARTQLASS